ncbi:hypothetical protein [Sporomusa sphaeroides]|uniref:Uncharacterized protein n=1 Tax=Sporomusa sphaeroides DSM 2875 TaxID=1337886 RepID=A0ABM9VZV7_9FIRM|nr:hypothetical protein [Sporomusa sphaeroides]OLS56343.1 hypothetical protein SPSPH_27360 [Sporomusa sphaeroides DSM 2875]CVK18438.1 hypothetical protein SSPH_01076 [Sporomusa sphaeroides DSM 2875]
MQGISDLALEINPQCGRFSGEQIDRLIAAFRRAGGSDENIKEVIIRYHTEYMPFGPEEFCRSIEALFPNESWRDGIATLMGCATSRILRGGLHTKKPPI